MIRRQRQRLVIVGVIAVQTIVLAVLLIVSSRRVPEDVVRLVRETASSEGVDPDLAEALVRIESKGDPRARSRVGAIGLLQLMPATAREVAAREGIEIEGEEDLYDPGKNARIGLIYLRDMLNRFGGDERLALAAYNAGPGRVQGWMDTYPGLGPEALLREAAFTETRDHVAKVLATRDGLVAGRR